MIGDETEYLQPVLGLQPNQRFKPLNSSWAGGLLLFLVVLLEASGILVVTLWPKTRYNDQCDPLYFLLYCHVALWFLVLLLDHVLKFYHNKLRLDGYSAAYEQCTKYGSLPFYIVSLGNAVLLMVETIYEQQNFSKTVHVRVCSKEWDSPLVVELIVISLETLVVSYILIVYLVKVYGFNKVRAPPDVSNVDTWEAFTTHEVGYRERGEDIQDLLEKQADSIRYYKDAIEVLQRKVMGLTAQLRGDAIN